MNWFRDRMTNFRLTGSQENHSLEQEIEQKAYELWEEAGRPEETFDYYYKKAQLEQEIKPTAYLLWEESGKAKGEFHNYLKQAEIEIEIRLMTYLLWKKDGQPEDKYEYYEDYYWEKAKSKVKFKRLPIIYKPFYFFVGKPYYFLEKKVLEPGLAWTDKQAFFDIIGRLGNLAIVIGVISFIFTEDYRRNAEVFSAWQTITSAEGQSGSGGRIKALEFLNSRPLRLPLIGFSKEYWYWDKWNNQCKRTWRLGYRFPRQSLRGLSAPKAYLSKIKLCGANLGSANLEDADLLFANLQNAKLPGANLEDADLFKANLQNAYLFKANLQNAYLFEANLEDADLLFANLEDADLLFANLQNANLAGANLEDAKLAGANLQNARYTDLKSTLWWCLQGSCSTIFPDGFEPKKAGMILMRTQEDYEKWKESRQK
ncbi:MAG: pentapeptide repeat-containing protein [Crocosphaera sp.]